MRYNNPLYHLEVYVFRRFPISAFILVLAFCAVTPALASSHLVGEKKTAANGLYFGEGLVPAHHYRLVITGKKHLTFRGTALENYTYVVGKQLGVGHKTIQLKGTLPHSYTLAQPVRGKLSGWSVVMQVGVSKGAGLTVQIYDLGRK